MVMMMIKTMMMILHDVSINATSALGFSVRIDVAGNTKFGFKNPDARAAVQN